MVTTESRWLVGMLGGDWQGCVQGLAGVPLASSQCVGPSTALAVLVITQATWGPPSFSSRTYELQCNSSRSGFITVTIVIELLCRLVGLRLSFSTQIVARLQDQALALVFLVDLS